MPRKVGIHCGAKKKYLDSRRVESSTRFRENDKLSQYWFSRRLEIVGIIRYVAIQH